MIGTYIMTAAVAQAAALAIGYTRMRTYTVHYRPTPRSKITHTHKVRALTPQSAARSVLLRVPGAHIRAVMVSVG